MGATIGTPTSEGSKIVAGLSNTKEVQSFAETARSGNALYQQQRFTHHGLTFFVEAEEWPNGNAARVAMATLRKWVTQWNANQTTRLFVALMHEREAIVGERDFDYQQEPLPEVRAAQRLAAREAMPGKDEKDLDWPLLILEAGVL